MARKGIKGAREVTLGLVPLSSLVRLCNCAILLCQCIFVLRKTVDIRLGRNRGKCS